ncbi:hypothetical protein [Nitrospirillum viridazoti]|uniref:Uncharacterized protein n=2 Tax=Nitrospirillum TaxID=1543705 RepID=A0A560IB90_9PROT|nr:hypothetical protein [Nitrospirillum amazonense]TWB54314.1 hypothetical protein FBZ92_11581 [Nitrospirillum amazonense]
MVRLFKADARSYYDTLPMLAHRCGDIWRGLPTLGSLGTESCAGLVITPACDLSWQKSDTVTYLPIVPIRAYFSLDAALPLVLEKISAAISLFSGDNLPKRQKYNVYMSPSHDELDALKNGVVDFLENQPRSDKIKIAASRVLSGIEIIKKINSGNLCEIESGDISTLFGSDWQKMKDRMIRNSFSPAIHFLPSDNQEEIFSGVQSHSLVLFRYPITIPVKILNIAQEIGASDWRSQIDSMGIPRILKESLGEVPPIKVLTLKSFFLSDLLTRFSALYNRVGSPDFSDDTITAYINEVDM